MLNVYILCFMILLSIPSALEKERGHGYGARQPNEG